MLHLQINFCFTTGCFILITFIYCKWKIENKFENCVVSLNRNQTVAHIVSEKYLSFGLDSSLLRNVEKLPIQNTKFVKLVRYLSPAYIRIGGTAADCLYFSNLKTGIKVSPKQGINGSIIDGYDISNFTISDKDFLSLYKFSHSARIQMIFDLNVLLRNTNGSWNSNNAKKIVNFAKRHGMQIDWQLGNEPNSFFHVFGRAISAEQLAKDYCALRILLNNLGYQGSSIFGPEINHIDNKNDNGVVYGQKFLKNAKNCINDFTWHQYYLNGHIAKLQDFLNLTVFNRLSLEINIISKAIKLIGYNISMWLSETSSAYGGGAPNLSNRFVAGFLWLDKLGYSAKMGIQVVIRQSLFGASYAMIDNNLNPNPDWWIAVIFKQFVSKKVLILTMPNHFKNIRLYAHCALMHDFMNKASAVIYGINISKEQTKLYIQGLAQEARIFSYILTSDYLMSRQIFMNGQILKLKKNGSLPQFKPDVIRSDQPIILPPYSIVFLVINEVKFSACSK